MTISLILDIITLVIILMAMYFASRKVESREKHLVLYCMRLSLLDCVLELIEPFLVQMQVPELLELEEIISILVIGLLFVFYFHYTICVTGITMDRRITAGLMSLFVAEDILLLTGTHHHLFFRKLEAVRTGDGLLYLEKEYGAGFYFYCVLLIIVSILVIDLALRYQKETRINFGDERKRQADFVPAVSFIPVFVCLLFFADSAGNFDFKSLGIGVSGILLIYAFKHFNYMDIILSAKEQVAEHMDIGLLIFDRDGRFLETNQFMRERFWQLWEKSGLSDPCEELKEATTKENSEIEWEGRSYRCHRSEIRGTGGILDGYALTIYDVTEMEEHAKQLEDLRKKAERANEQKTEFLTNVTHEIRTPLNTILGMSEIALRKNTVKDLEAPLKNIYHEGEGVLELVDTLLDVSKLEAGTIELSDEKYSMEEILYEISNMIYMRIDKRDLDYKVEVEPGFPRAFYGDRMRVKEIFQNLLGNALKYTECGIIRLVLGGEKEEDGRYKIILSVKDTGVGMSEHDKENIFRRFSRIENPKTAGVFGAGLGLNITMSLVHLMDGNIQVQSRLNEGTTFTASFYQKIADDEPLWLEDMTRERAASYLEDNSFLEQIHVVFPGAQVLLVDDMESNLVVERGLLQLYEIEPEMVMSGKDALHLLKNRKYDLIFLDHMMPGMDGIETLQKIRQTENGREVPVVAVTANAVAYTTDFYEKNGFDESLTKPLHTAELLEVLKRYIPSKIQNKRVEAVNEGGGNLPIKYLMPEIDCVEGIGNIGGSLEKYNELLRSYYNEMSQIMEVLPDYAKDDLEQFRIKIHGVKGSSRNIGAEELAEEALRMEEWAKQGKQKEILTEMNPFLQRMDRVMTRVSSYLKEASKNVERDGDFLPELELTGVYQILKALAKFDMDEVEDTFQELYQNRYADDAEAVLEELKRNIEELDYEHATLLLEDYLERIG